MISVVSWNKLKPAGPILEGKGVSGIFQKKSKEMLKLTKYLKIWAKMYKLENILKKGR